jgi:long-chain acyl-CoA synthetase
VHAAVTGAPASAWADDPQANAAAEVIARRGRSGGSIGPESNLELDLGLDSMERVELITELEQRFGVRLRDDQAHQILTVGQLIDAVKSGSTDAAARVADDSWAVVLRDLPTDTDPILGGILKPRPFAAPMLFAIMRFLRLIGPRVVVSGVDHLPETGPFIISPNHQSYVDPFIVNGVLPYKIFKQLFFVGAAEYFETPLTRRLAKISHLLPVDPDANLVPAMKASAFGLAHGKVLMLFPEGERSIDGTVKKFKKGAPILSRHLNVPIVPVALKGAFEIWPRNRRFNWRSLLPGARRPVAIAFGPPVRFDGTTSDGEAAVELRSRVARMWDLLE